MRRVGILRATARLDARYADAVREAGGDPFPIEVCRQAAQTSVAVSTREPVRDAQINVVGSLELLEQCVRLRVGRVVYASTGGAEYGEVPDGERASIEWAPRPLSSLPEPIEREQIARTEVVRWPGAGGFDVEGLLTYPLGYEPGRRYPMLVVIHGGPTWQFVADYLGTPDPYPIAAFAARGFAVLRPNPRGSSGRGRAFRYAVRGDWAGEDARDILAGVDHAVALGVADPELLGVMGWSYGGYMTNWLVAEPPVDSPRFAAVERIAEVRQVIERVERG